MQHVWNNLSQILHVWSKLILFKYCSEQTEYELFTWVKIKLR